MARSQEKHTGLVIDISKNKQADFGAATSYILRHLCNEAGTYQPERQEKFFFMLERPAFGSSLQQVASWLSSHKDTLTGVGVRLGMQSARVETKQLLDWIKAGKGGRAALVVINGKRLMPGEDVKSPTALAIIQDGNNVRCASPWPTAKGSDKLPPDLLKAHRDEQFKALVFFQPGYA